MTKIFLKQLLIENLILVSKSSVDFEKGFTVISGETGSGKSSLLYALKLALGERGDPQKIREGAEKGKVTALFDVEGPFPYLEEFGIEIEDTLLITREISKNGKSRAFINHAPVQIQLLKELSRFLITTLDQGSSLVLKDEKEQLRFLDLAAKNGPTLRELQELEATLRSEQKELEKLRRLSQEKEREKAILEREKEEIELAAVQPGEEELLFQEYRLLTTAEERRSLISKCQAALESSVHYLHPRLRDIEVLSELDPHLKDDLEGFSSTLVELNEIRSTLNRAFGSTEIDDGRLEELNSRLELIEKLKKRYGNTFETLQQITDRLKLLESLDDTLEQSEENVKSLQKEVAHLQQKLLERRKKILPTFEKQIEALLKELNFPQVEFKVHLESHDKASFWLAPNVGEKMVPVSGGVSGGEMARLLLSLLILLSHEEGRVILLFDEMDAHIGGRAAAMMGQKLKALAVDHQVIAITHFSQVAEIADHHIAIGKLVSKDRTIATITTLTTKERPLELLRMSGEPALI